MTQVNIQTIDQALLNKQWRLETERAAQLNMAQHMARQEQWQQQEEALEDMLVTEEMAVYQRRLALEAALKPLYKKETKVRKKIKQNTLGGGSFLAILVVSGMKDLLDIFSLGFFGWFLNIVSGFMLAVIFLLQPHKVRKELIRVFALPGATETIPLLSFLPSYTTATFRAKIKLESAVKKLKEQRKKIQKKIKRLQREFGKMYY